MVPASKKITKRRLKWYGHAMRGRTHTEESVEDGYIKEKEERTTENETGKILDDSWRGDGQGA